ncbi:MAG: hypothetical protein AUK51_13680 [Comamonadaceae bacterium CG2_30_59_20]|nr:MAG: hypothetical protein AUK51_13680 [Comamonadaceae bacterium CG2_30_59_20]
MNVSDFTSPTNPGGDPAVRRVVGLSSCVSHHCKARPVALLAARQASLTRTATSLRGSGALASLMPSKWLRFIAQFEKYSRGY